MEEKIKQANPILHRYLFTVTTFSKILAIIFFIVLPFLAFYLGMRYQEKLTLAIPVISEVQKITIPTPTSKSVDTSNWKTYTNTKVGFSIKYPDRYSPPEVPGGLGPVIYANGTEVKTEIGFGTSYYDSFGLIPVPFSSSLDDFLKAEQEHLSKNDASLMGVWYGNIPKTLVKKIFINDNIPNALLYDTTSKGDKEAHVLLPNGYVLVFLSDGQINEDEFEEAIKSLKLTK